MIQEIQKAILNNETIFKGFELPTRQTSGTDSQIVTYAYMQAQKFYEDNLPFINELP